MAPPPPPPPPPPLAIRKPTYVWAQNGSHTFVTLRLNTEERRIEPHVRFGSRGFDVKVPAVDRSIELTLEVYKQVWADACGWSMTSRGLLLRLRKRAPNHWPRLLKDGVGNEGPAGVDWTRWNHPVAEQAVQRESDRDQFDRLNAARIKELQELRPQFQRYLTTFQEAKEREEAMAPDDQLAMLRTSEKILQLFREEREQRYTLLGDEPLPAGVEEEQLERAILVLRNNEREGHLKLERNSPSWKEFRRRQNVRSGVEVKKKIRAARASREFEAFKETLNGPKMLEAPKAKRKKKKKKAKVSPSE